VTDTNAAAVTTTDAVVQPTSTNTPVVASTSTATPPAITDQGTSAGECSVVRQCLLLTFQPLRPHPLSLRALL
nr:hypothetical protein [Tanacetum cinerariifolium]